MTSATFIQDWPQASQLSSSFLPPAGIRSLEPGDPGAKIEPRCERRDWIMFLTF